MTKSHKNKNLNKYHFLNYKNSNSLKKYISVDCKILPKFITMLTPKEQRRLSKSVKTARILGLLKFINN